MTRASRAYLIVFTVALAILVGACNVFEGLYDEGTSENTQVLLTDARAAIQDGRVDDAVDHLTKAHENEPDNVEVRAELASALLTQNDIDVMLIKDLADDIRLALEGGASKNAGCPEDVRCNFNCAVAKSVTPFSYKDSDAYQRLAAVLAVLRQIDALVQQPLSNLGATPGIRFDTKEKRAELFSMLVSSIEAKNPSANSQRIAGTLLLSAGITKLATTLTEIEQAAAERDVQLYHVESLSGSTFIDYCGREVEAFVDTIMCPATSTAFFTLDMLAARAENSSGNALSNELLDSGHELFDEFTTEVQSQCGIR